MQKKKVPSNKKTASRKKAKTKSSGSSARGRIRNRASSINIEKISDISGEVNIAGGDITITRISTLKSQQLFDSAYKKIEAKKQISSDQRDALVAEVEEIQSAVTAGPQNKDKLDESFLAHHFRNIARMAPDVLDVAVKTLANPALGLGEVARKIAIKATKKEKL
jgi:hypothetical protein